MQGTPLIRYRTYDMSFLIEPPCPCGWKTVGKIGKVSGRLDALTKIGLGDKVFPLLFDEAVLSVPGVLNYRVIIESSKYKDRLTFQVEMNAPLKDSKDQLLNAIVALPEIIAGLENDLLETPIVEILDPGSIGFTPKSSVIVDKRGMYDTE
jgi:phenylacetate-CoA ligase